MSTYVLYKEYNELIKIPPGHPKHLVSRSVCFVFLFTLHTLLDEGKSSKQPGDSEEVSKEY